MKAPLFFYKRRLYQVAEKILNTRIQQKHGTNEDWSKATNFKPLNGEFIIYDADSTHTIPRIKVGNNNTQVQDLPFFFEGFTEAELLNLLTNAVVLSIDKNGNIYNGGLGYKNGYRVRSGGAEAEDGTGVCSGYIAVNPGDTVQISGYDITAVQSSNAINVSNAAFENLGQIVANYADAGYGIFAAGTAYQSYCWNSGVVSNGTYTWTVPPEESGIAYIRVSGYNIDGSKLTVIINGG